MCSGEKSPCTSRTAVTTSHPLTSSADPDPTPGEGSPGPPSSGTQTARSEASTAAVPSAPLLQVTGVKVEGVTGVSPPDPALHVNNATPQGLTAVSFGTRVQKPPHPPDAETEAEVTGAVGIRAPSHPHLLGEAGAGAEWAAGTKAPFPLHPLDEPRVGAVGAVGTRVPNPPHPLGGATGVAGIPARHPPHPLEEAKVEATVETGTKAPNPPNPLDDTGDEGAAGSEVASRPHHWSAAKAQAGVPGSSSRGPGPWRTIIVLENVNSGMARVTRRTHRGGTYARRVCLRKVSDTRFRLVRFCQKLKRSLCTLKHENLIARPKCESACE